MSDSETIYSESERSEDSDSEGSLVDFVADSDEEPETCLACHAELCVSNIINRKRRHAEVVREESDDEDDEGDEGDEGDEADEGSEDSDSSSDYVPSDVSDSCSDGSYSEGE